MAGDDKYLLNRNGRYFARIVVPQNLRVALGKSELRLSLGPDRRTALKGLATAVSELQLEIRRAELQLTEADRASVPSLRFPMKFDEIARRNYVERLAQDETARLVKGYANVSLDPGFAEDLRAGIAGKLTDRELVELVGYRIDGFKRFGNTAVEFGSNGWRELAQKLCRSEYEALLRAEERDEGNFEGETQDALLRQNKQQDPSLPSVSIRQLVQDYNTSQKLVGKGRGAEPRWAPVFRHLLKFLGHDDARKVTKQNLIAWRDKILEEGRSARTVGTVWLAAVRAVLNWAVAEDRIATNVAVSVRQASPRNALSRPKGYTDSEAQAVLEAAWNYEPRSDKEFPETTAAKRWVSLLCALTGARVTEITQLRKKDILRDGDIWIFRLSPEGGALKTGDFRDVPIHPQLIELGFLKFVEQSSSGPLFYRSANPKGKLSGARTVSGRISQWLNKLDLVPEGVSPNHGWRHRFMTVAYEVKASERIVRAICGHGDRNVGETYGDVTVKAKLPIIELYPHYDLLPK